jgi:hypothetical protein
MNSSFSTKAYENAKYINVSKHGKVPLPEWSTISTRKLYPVQDVPISKKISTNTRVVTNDQTKNPNVSYPPYTYTRDINDQYSEHYRNNITGEVEISPSMFKNYTSCNMSTSKTLLYQVTANNTTTSEPPQLTANNTTTSEPPQLTDNNTTTSEPPQLTVNNTITSEPPQLTANTNPADAYTTSIIDNVDTSDVMVKVEPLADITYIKVPSGIPAPPPITDVTTLDIDNVQLPKLQDNTTVSEYIIAEDPVTTDAHTISHVSAWKLSVMGMCYDAKHWNELPSDNKFAYITQRQDRLPYLTLTFVIFLTLLCILVFTLHYCFR